MNKKELRLHIKNILNQNQTDLKKESERIAESIIHSDLFSSANLILAYMALPDEADLEKVIKSAITAGKTVALPRICSGTSRMNFYKITNLGSQSFTKSEASFNISEPEEKKENLIMAENLPEKTLILVPGRAFSTDGTRLGRGKGFYDLWLGKIPEDKKNRVHLAGVCFPLQIAENIPTDEHDIKMNSLFY